jgi:hypothetical protein
MGAAVVKFDAAKWMIIGTGRGKAVKAVALVGAVGTTDAANELTINRWAKEEVVTSETVVALWRIGVLDSIAR